MEEFKYLIRRKHRCNYYKCRKIKEIENHLRHVFSNHGYNEVLMPSFEYVDLYTKLDCGFTVDKMFQYINHEGKNVAMRLDFTIPLADFMLIVQMKGKHVTVILEKCIVKKQCTKEEAVSFSKVV